MRGRGIVALLLLGFVLMTGSVIWRRSVGVAQVRRIEQLEQQRADLAARRAVLQSEVRDAASRARLARVAEERLGMRIPSDSHVITILRPARRDTP